MNAAVVVETRSLDSFPATVREHMKHLKGFELVIFGSNENEDFLTKNISDFVHHKVHYPTFGQFEYNLTLTNPKFWEILSGYDRVVIFQHDSGILKDGIEEFLQYDYVGAPWKFQPHGGNGGLSVRNPKAMLELCTEKEWHQNTGNEDVFFCNLMKTKPGMNLAPRVVMQHFSVETIFQMGTLGFHAIDQWLTPQQCEQIRGQYK